MNYDYDDLKNAVTDIGAGGSISATKQLRAILNRAAREVGARVDLRSAKRRSALSPNLYQSVYQYTKPTDLKGLGLIDVMPQTKRTQGYRSELILTTPEEFDRMKSVVVDTIVGAIYDADGVGKLLLSVVVDDNKVTLHECDSLTSDGTWAAVAGTAAQNLSVDSTDFINGHASIKFDVAATGTTPTIEVTGMTAKDLTNQKGHDLLAWVKIPSGGVSKITSYTLRWTDSSGNYVERAVTTTNEGLSFQTGWNLLRFPWDASVTESGTLDVTDITSVRLLITLSGVLGSVVSNWGIDFIVARAGVPYDVIYYSKYMWQTSAGVYLENSTADTDYLNVDTDEFDLIVARAEILLARAGRDARNIVDAKNNYKETEDNYTIKYPSEAKPLTTSYYNLSSLGENASMSGETGNDTN